MISFSLLQNNGNLFAEFPFYSDGQPLENAPLCGITLKNAGSMRFRWNEQNPLRDKLLNQLAKQTDKAITPVAVQLNHTHIVYDISKKEETDLKIGDGIITTNKLLMPVVTVADCVPIYLFDKATGVFGIVHSGWKGTGIAVDAINMAAVHGSSPENFCIVIGPHINNCCYIVDKNRAEFFINNFGVDCVTPLEAGVKVDWNNGEGPLYRLSLAKANLNALLNAGVKEQNITLCTDCTCCNEMYGSNRRETKKNGRPDAFTVQAAFIKW